jgi:hypothetical protein
MVATSRRAGLPLLVSGLLLAALWSVGTASAAPATSASPAVRYAVGSAGMLAAQDVARRTWGADACAGAVTISWASDSPLVQARSSWANPVALYGDPDGNIDCRIVFNAARAMTWAQFCTVVVHEYGHLTGHPHTAEGTDVMSPVQWATLPACDAIADPAAAATVRLAPTARHRAR